MDLQTITGWLEKPQVHLPLILALSLLLGAIAQYLMGRVVAWCSHRTAMEADDRIAQALRSPIAVSVVLIGCAYALTLCDLGEGVERVTVSVLKTIAIIIWTIAVSRLASIFIDIFSTGEHRLKLIQPQTKPLLLMASKAVVIGGSLYFLSLAWNKDVTAWLASAGIIGIAVGFAAKDTLANLFSGIFIVADGPYKLGHYVVLDNGLRGRVTNIGLRSTRILTRDDVEVTVPNAIMGNSTVVNESGGPHEKYRVRVDVTVAYGSDIDLVEEILVEIAKNEKLISEFPAPRVRFRSFGDSALEFQLLAWIARPELRGQAIHQLNRTIYKSFQEAKIEIPFPQRDLHLRSTVQSGS